MLTGGLSFPLLQYHSGEVSHERITSAYLVILPTLVEVFLQCHEDDR